MEGEEIRKWLGIQVHSPHFRVCRLGAFFRVAFSQVPTCMTGTGHGSHKYRALGKQDRLHNMWYPVEDEKKGFLIHNYKPFQIMMVEHEIKCDIPQGWALRSTPL